MKTNDPFLKAIKEHMEAPDHEHIHSYVVKAKCEICGQNFALVFHLKVYKDMHEKYRKLHNCPKCEMLAIIHEYNWKVRGNRRRF